MRYQSFYPFSQQQTPNIPQQVSPPQNRFLSGLMGLGNAGAPQAPNNFPNGPSQLPFGLGNMGAPQASNRFPGAPSQIPFGLGNSGSPQVPNRMEQYLQTADRFLSTAQQLTPMVKQVAPMVQNIPALWKIYRGFQNMPDATTTSAVSSASAAAVTRTIGTSQPRIFQPPF